MASYCSMKFKTGKELDEALACAVNAHECYERAEAAATRAEASVAGLAGEIMEYLQLTYQETSTGLGPLLALASCDADGVVVNGQVMFRENVTIPDDFSLNAYPFYDGKIGNSYQATFDKLNGTFLLNTQAPITFIVASTTHYRDESETELVDPYVKSLRVDYDTDVVRAVPLIGERVNRLENDMGDVETALDGIIAIQTSLIGGETV